MRLAIIFALAIVAQAQTFYSVTKTTALSAAAEVITIQQPSTGAVFVQLSGFYTDCTVACTITLERNGTPATATTLAVNKLNKDDAVATVTAFSSSDVGTGTVLAKYTLTAGGQISADLSKIHFPPTSTTTNNFTIRTSSITGTVNIVLQFNEVKN